MLGLCIFVTVVAVLGAFACILCFIAQDGIGLFMGLAATFGAGLLSTMLWINYSEIKSEIDTEKEENTFKRELIKEDLIPKEIGYYNSDSTFVIIDTIYIKR